MCIYHEVSPQESLKEAALSTADIPENIAVEDAALGLLLLQVKLLVSGDCRMEAKSHQFQLLWGTTHTHTAAQQNCSDTAGDTTALTFTHIFM